MQKLTYQTVARILYSAITQPQPKVITDRVLETAAELHTRLAASVEPPAQVLQASRISRCYTCGSEMQIGMRPLRVVITATCQCCTSTIPAASYHELSIHVHYIGWYHLAVQLELLNLLSWQDWSLHAKLAAKSKKISIDNPNPLSHTFTVGSAR